MVGTYKEYSWLQIKLTSTSLKDVKLVMLDLFVNPEYSKFIEKVEAIHLLADSSVVLKTGESFECLFKLKIGELPEDYDTEDLTSMLNGGPRSCVLQKPLPSDNSIQRMKTLFLFKSLESFAELQFKF